MLLVNELPIMECDLKNSYSVKYEDKYVFQNEKWLIKERIGYFVMIELRTIS
ncbi:hypothetical protein SAMN06265171_11547 [Chryseobacterium rhizoplanae]|uniref:Uncharacterized protein n=1 Tax=Chryseobacterium rhizoplanae TaxID=1609531 RepID=A0A521FIX7_9FLAO|nr:hypothetical protein [Chryseobacterium rhizoplanae]SMO95530.1 hypothetical protein SAMN06265171_11547 [Chryseobacterium rhizoplanae]